MCEDAKQHRLPLYYCFFPIVLHFCELLGVITCSMHTYPIFVSVLTNIPYLLKYYRYNILKLTSWSLNLVGMAGPGLIMHIFCSSLSCHAISITLVYALGQKNLMLKSVIKQFMGTKFYNNHLLAA